MKCREKEVKGIEREKRHILMFLACSLACLGRMRAKQKKWRFRPNHVRSWEFILFQWGANEVFKQGNNKINISLRQIILAAIGEKRFESEKLEIRKPGETCCHGQVGA